MYRAEASAPLRQSIAVLREWDLSKNIHRMVVANGRMYREQW